MLIGGFEINDFTAAELAELQAIDALPAEARAQLMDGIRALAIGITKATEAMAKVYRCDEQQVFLALCLALGAYIKAGSKPERRLLAFHVAVEAMRQVVFRGASDDGKDHSRKAEPRRQGEPAPGVPEAGSGDLAG